MNQASDFILCKNFINEFIEEYLKGDIYAFLYFDFASLHQDKRFGCNSRGFDCDDTNITRAICFILWGEIFPDITFSDIGTGNKYRGDTLNTFHTVLGAYLPDKHSCLGIEKSNADNRLRVLANKFHAIYHSIGNFILLPNIAETDKKRAYTFNTYRGIAYKDYFVDDKPQEIFSPFIYCLRKRQEWTNSEKSFYIEHVEKYIISATNIIQNRAKKIIEKLSMKCC